MQRGDSNNQVSPPNQSDQLDNKGGVPEGKTKLGDENGESTGGETPSSSDAGEDGDSVMSWDDEAEIRRQVDAFIDALWRIPPDMPREEQRQYIEELLDNPPPADKS